MRGEPGGRKETEEGSLKLPGRGRETKNFRMRENAEREREKGGGNSGLTLERLKSHHTLVKEEAQ